MGEKSFSKYISGYGLVQWRRQDLLRGGAKIEIVSWGTHAWA